jgi:hypothetical protein
MAAQQSPSPLRRWKRLFPVFSTIDAAIVASAPGGQISDDVTVLRKATRDVVQDLSDVPEDDAAEDLCRLLDDVMVEYLITLKGAVRVTVTTPSLGKALGSLEDLHESKRVRELARFVRVSIAKARTRLEKPDEREKRMQVNDAPSGTTRRVEVPGPAREVPAWLPKNGAPVGGGTRRASTAANNIDKPPTKTPGRAGMNGMVTESAKRKLLELDDGYQQELEAADAKRRREIPVIYPPNEMAEQRRRKTTHPVLTERGRGSSGVSNTAARRF